MPVFAVKASITFWKALRSPPPQLAITVIVRFPADADAAGAAVPCAPGCCTQAVATKATTSATGMSEDVRTRTDIGFLPAVENAHARRAQTPCQSRRQTEATGTIPL